MYSHLSNIYSCMKNTDSTYICYTIRHWMTSVTTVILHLAYTIQEAESVLYIYICSEQKTMLHKITTYKKCNFFLCQIMPLVIITKTMIHINTLLYIKKCKFFISQNCLQLFRYSDGHHCVHVYSVCTLCTKPVLQLATAESHSQQHHR